MKIASWVALVALILVAPSSAQADVLISTDTTQNGGTFVVDPAGTLTISGSSNPLLTMTGGAQSRGITTAAVGNQSSERGQLLVDQGSILSSSSDSYLGNLSGAIGTVTVSGMGSQWNNSGDTYYIGYGGTGTLNIEKGASVTSRFSVLGTKSDSVGTATITGVVIDMATFQ